MARVTRWDMFIDRCVCGGKGELAHDAPLEINDISWQDCDIICSSCDRLVTLCIKLGPEGEKEVATESLLINCWNSFQRDLNK